MRGDVEGAEFALEVLGVIALVGAERDPARAVGARLDHVQGGHALGMAGRPGQAGVEAMNSDGEAALDQGFFRRY